ncbi:MAG: phosphodiester glycosidase family protein [Pseudomonadota bacterium]
MRERSTEDNPFSNLSPSEIVARLSKAKASEASRIFRGLIEKEQELSLRNLLKPYDDKVPLVLQQMDVSSIAGIFQELDDYHIMKALFGNFRTVREQKRQKILEVLERGKLALLLNRMSIGVDRPKEAAKIIRNLPIRLATQTVDAMETVSVLRVFRELTPEHSSTIMANLSSNRAAELAEAMLGKHNAVRVARLANILRNMNDLSRQKILSAIQPAQRDLLMMAIGQSPGSLFDNIDPRDAKHRCAEMPYEALALELDRANPETIVEVLKLMDSWKASQVLTIMGQSDVQKVADLLEEMNQKVIIGFRGHGKRKTCIQEIYSCPAAGILEHLDLGIQGNVRALRRLSQEVLDSLLDRVREDKRTEIGSLIKEKTLYTPLPFSLQLFTVGSGTRRTRDLGRGLKWTRIQERIDTGVSIKPVIIDLVEMDPKSISIKACRAITEDKLVPIHQVAKLIGDAKREGKRPDKGTFTKLGLVQLSQVVQKSGAIAAINGNHYFDYGHYMDCISLGIDPTKVPGLFFGDPVGWFVADAEEVSPPTLNRAALIVTQDGNTHIERVFMTEVKLSNGSRVQWNGINIGKKEGRLILYNSLYGFQTPDGPSHVEVAIAKNRVIEIRPAGGGLIPLTGFVLALPIEQQETVLNGVAVGDPVEVGNNFPSSLGRVEQAMACGPYLVRDGQLAISFEEEDFGEKDSSVMAFSLTRATETFEAARSFIMLRDNHLHLGAVSGAALGTGTSGESAGMTFGELAQLAMDLRADQAYALDGGGSSSIAVRVGSQVRILNIPTGGSDVAKGEERHINTYWLFFERKS